MTEKKARFPPSTLFIFASFFFERFSFHGIRTLLPLFLKNALDLTEQNSTVVYHIFFMCCYFTPLIGAVIADSIIGNYNTIVWFSTVFIVGGGLISATSIPIPEIPAKNILVYLSLALIALGSGGLKPCISSVGGDQFNTPELTIRLSLFFSIFTWVGNAANLLSTFVTPILRSDVHCFGENSCFSLIFLLATSFVILSLVSMLFGKRYFYLKKHGGNVLLKISKCIWYSISQRIKNGKSHKHWLDSSIAAYGDKMVKDTKKVMKVLLLYLPLPIFWALLDQQGSRWTFQAERMSGNLFNIYVIKPDQFQVINRVMILVLIPLFDRVLYPLLSKFNLLKNPLHRMLIGGILAALSFGASGILEMALENLEEGQEIHMMWQLPQYILMTTADIMFQITGMEFAYSQAPSSMKSFMQAMWLLTIAVGNLLVAIIAHVSIFNKNSQESFLFAGIMFADMVIFGFVAKHYKTTSVQQCKNTVSVNDDTISCKSEEIDNKT